MGCDKLLSCFIWDWLPINLDELGSFWVGAVVLNFLSSTIGGSTAQSMELTGIAQATNIRRLGGLRVEGWFSMRQTVSAVAARMRVQVGNFEVCYYVAYDSEQRLRYYDTPVSKAVFVYQIGPGQYDWWQLDRNVMQDFESLFGSDGQGAFQQEQTTVAIALELMGFGYIPTYQVMPWDDVQATAMVSANSTTTTGQLSTSTTSSVVQSMTSTSTSSLSSSTSSTLMETPQLSGSALTLMQASVIIAVVLTLVACFFLAGRTVLKRKPTGVRCTSCGATDPRTDSVYCSKCGTKLNRPARQEASETKPPH